MNTGPREVAGPGEHPLPPTNLHTRTPLIHEAAGPWLRVSRVDHEPLYFSKGAESRFNDPIGAFGVLYIADDLGGAFLETFGRQLDVRSVTSSQLRSRHLSRVEAARPLRLVNLASPGGLARLSADNRLTAGGFAVAQSWARSLWEHPAKADGVYYRLRHDPARCGCAIFDRAQPLLSASVLGTLWDVPRRRELGDLLDTLGFALILE